MAQKRLLKPLIINGWGYRRLDVEVSICMERSRPAGQQILAHRFDGG